MGAVWAISGKGTFASLDLGDLRRNLVNGAPDEVTFDAPGNALADPLFAYKESVTITKDGVAWFTGVNLTTPRLAYPAEERVQYRLAGPWWYLEQCVYQQYWKLYNAATGGVTNQYKSRVILCHTIDGDRLDSGEQITAAINYAIGKGADLANGTIDPAVEIPYEEVTDISCAEVILRMMRWSPDCVAWFDYSTTPPTLHVRKRANLSAVTVAFSGAPASGLSITPRNDLAIPGVLLRYEQTHEVDNGDGTSTVTNSVTTDSAGNTDALDTLISTVGLAGSNVRYLREVLKIRKLPTSLADKDFWQRRVPILKAYDQADITIENVARIRDASEITEIVEGTLQDWIVDKFEVAGGDDEITADVSVQLRDGGGNVLGDPVKEKHTIRLVTTDAIGSGAVWDSGETVEKVYRHLDAADYGEDVPVGVAAQLYGSLSVIHYDGAIDLTEEDPASGANPGKVLNITGGLLAWSTMKALIQRVEESVDDGRTRIVFGPPKHLTLEDILALLRAFRVRTTAAARNQDARVTGTKEDQEDGGFAAKNEVSKVPLIPPMPDGGSKYQALTKSEDDDYDADWDYVRFHD